MERENQLIIVRGGGDIATGTIHKLHRCGYPVLVLETAAPSAIRRQVALSEAVYDGVSEVEGADFSSDHDGDSRGAFSGFFRVYQSRHGGAVLSVAGQKPVVLGGIYFRRLAELSGNFPRPHLSVQRIYEGDTKFSAAVCAEQFRAPDRKSVV